MDVANKADRPPTVQEVMLKILDPLMRPEDALEVLEQHRRLIGEITYNHHKPLLERKREEACIKARKKARSEANGR